MEGSCGLSNAVEGHVVRTRCVVAEPHGWLSWPGAMPQLSG